MKHLSNKTPESDASRNPLQENRQIKVITKKRRVGRFDKEEQEGLFIPLCSVENPKTREEDKKVCFQTP